MQSVILSEAPASTPRQGEAGKDLKILQSSRLETPSG